MSAEVPPSLPADIAQNPRLSTWFRVAEDGLLEVRAGKVELGQGVRTTQRLVAAEELDVLPGQIRLTTGDTSVCPDQGLTAGSLSTEVGAMALRRVCAEVRQRFVAAAARRQGVAVDAVTVRDGRFGAGKSSTLGYSDLVAEVDLDAPATGRAPPKAPHERRLVGTTQARPDLLAKLSGAAFIHDIEWPGMLHGRVVRPPTAGERLRRFDEAAQAALRALPGVHTLWVQGRHIALAAEREEQAIAAAAKAPSLIEWDRPETLPAHGDDQHWLRDQPAEDSVIDQSGSPLPLPDGTALAADYSRPFLAHASIGPSCALARWDGDRLTVCTHSQGSFTLRRELAMLFEMDAALITVVHADGAGCYGHNGADDAAIDAALLARAAGRPVRLQWSREDELAWSPFGPAMSVRIEAVLDAQGRIAHWHQQTWSYSHVQRPGLHPVLNCLAGALREPPALPPPLRDFPLPAGGGQRNAVPIYALPARRIDYHLLKTPTLRSSALRALGAFANVFAIESFMDEAAQRAGQDPLAFRLAHLAHDERGMAVLQSAALAADWFSPKAPARREGAARGRGLAMARYKNGSAWCAVVVEVEVSDRIVLDRVWAAVDAGEVVHLDGLINQIEGGVLQAASWTLKEAVGWDRQGVTSRSWDDYPILGFDEAPRSLEVQVIDHPDQPPLGVGECAAGPTAAAIANALADAVGVRVRDLPLTPERLQRAVLNA